MTTNPNWKIFCYTENKFIYTYISNLSGPSVCPNDEQHNVDVPTVHKYNFSNPQNILSNTTRPIYKDDSRDGYHENSMWVNADDVYICSDNTYNSAKWTNITKESIPVIIQAGITNGLNFDIIYQNIYFDNINNVISTPDCLAINTNNKSEINILSKGTYLINYDGTVNTNNTIYQFSCIFSCILNGGIISNSISNILCPNQQNIRLNINKSFVVESSGNDTLYFQTRSTNIIGSPIMNEDFNISVIKIDGLKGNDSPSTNDPQEIIIQRDGIEIIQTNNLDLCFDVRIVAENAVDVAIDSKYADIYMNNVIPNIIDNNWNIVKFNKIRDINSNNNFTLSSYQLTINNSDKYLFLCKISATSSPDDNYQDSVLNIRIRHKSANNDFEDICYGNIYSKNDYNCYDTSVMTKAIDLLAGDIIQVEVKNFAFYKFSLLPNGCSFVIMNI
jgi:hypothetical protein